MDLIPAIDLRGGEVVRLTEGRDDQKTSYGRDPRQVLEEFAAAGAEWVHVVDLDAAFGELPQRRLIAELVKASTVKIELGGGLRGADAVRWALDEVGCERVIMGSMVAKATDAFIALVTAHPGRLVPAVEVAAGRVRIAGWTEDAAVGIDELCHRLRGLDCPAILVTDVERDGTLVGPNVDLCRRVARESGLPVLLSGGVRSLEDLEAASQVDEIAGAIVGKAIYEGVFTVADALAVVKGGGHG